MKEHLRKTLEFIRNYQRDKGVSPSISDIGEHFKIGKTATAKRLKGLEDAGQIERDEKKRIRFDRSHYCQCD